MKSGKLTVWVFQTGEPLHCDEGSPRPMRAMNVANSLIKKGHRVVLWSSAFNHRKKQHRSKEYKVYKVNENLEIRLIPSIGYGKNIGVGRFIDHLELAVRLYGKLKDEVDFPDVAFVGFPPIEAAYVMISVLNKMGIPTIIDIKDQWPCIFIDRLPSGLKSVGRLLLSPYFFLAKRAIRKATAISTISESSMDWALGYADRERNKIDSPTPLTSEITEISDLALHDARIWWDKQGIGVNNIPCLFFVGTHSFTYDFEPVSDAIQLCLKNNIKIDFVICGTGNANSHIKSLLGEYSNVFFPGYVDLPKIYSLAERSIAALVNYKNTPDFINSIPNKAIDAMALGLPIVSPMDGEVGGMINRYTIGIQYANGASLYDAIRHLMQDKNKQQQMARNANNLYREKFEFNKVYDALVSKLENI